MIYRMRMQWKKWNVFNTETNGYKIVMELLSKWNDDFVLRVA